MTRLATTFDVKSSDYRVVLGDRSPKVAEQDVEMFLQTVAPSENNDAMLGLLLGSLRDEKSRIRFFPKMQFRENFLVSAKAIELMQKSAPFFFFGSFLL